MTGKALISGGNTGKFGMHKDMHFRDMVFDVASAALADSEIDPAEIDSLVVGSETDFFTLQLGPAQAFAEDLSLPLVATQRAEACGGSGGAALRAGFANILSGLSRHCLVIGYEMAASRLDPVSVRRLYGWSFDAEFEGWAGVHSTTQYALSFKSFQQRHPFNDQHLAQIARQNRLNGQNNPNCHKAMDLPLEKALNAPMVSDPYRRYDCSLISDGASAIILSAPETLDMQSRSHAPVYITGTGAATDRLRLGDRPDPGFFIGKQASARRAYQMAGISDPARQIDVAELYDAYTGAQLQAIEATGLSSGETLMRDTESGRFRPGGGLPVNLSGGLLAQGGAPGAVGVAQAVTACELLQGRYPGSPEAGRFRRALVDCHGGIATQNFSHILEAEA
jgi:acetyl-CoA C-acetyltransferase